MPLTATFGIHLLVIQTNKLRFGSTNANGWLNLINFRHSKHKAVARPLSEGMGAY